MSLTTFERLTVNVLTELVRIVLKLRLPDDDRASLVEAVARLRGFANAVDEPQWATDRPYDAFRDLFGHRAPPWVRNPPPAELPKPWWFAELGLTEWPPTREAVAKAWRAEAVKRHPDQGGTQESFVRLTQARDEALKSVGASSNG